MNAQKAPYKLPANYTHIGQFQANHPGRECWYCNDGVAKHGTEWNGQPEIAEGKPRPKRHFEHWQCSDCGGGNSSLIIELIDDRETCSLCGTKSLPEAEHEIRNRALRDLGWGYCVEEK